MKHRCHLDLQKHFFLERVSLIDRWNQLSKDCISCDTVNKFKGKLDIMKRWASSKIAHDLIGPHGRISWKSKDIHSPGVTTPGK